MNYKEFIKVTQEALESRDLNEYLEMMRAFSERETIFAKHME
jgi:Trp operon repressor